mmetsp:Transcript_58569/g.178621  ORF Transcript_58569/g.178621 Transcript_58569/m.178621 type:complete len:250 (+) Transcript_58569:284-1033(+)
MPLEDLTPQREVLRVEARQRMRLARRAEAPQRPRLHRGSGPTQWRGGGRRRRAAARGAPRHRGTRKLCRPPRCAPRRLRGRLGRAKGQPARVSGRGCLGPMRPACALQLLRPHPLGWIRRRGRRGRPGEVPQEGLRGADLSDSDLRAPLDAPELPLQAEHVAGDGVDVGPDPLHVGLARPGGRARVPRHVGPVLRLHVLGVLLELVDLAGELRRLLFQAPQAHGLPVAALKHCVGRLAQDLQVLGEAAV